MRRFTKISEASQEPERYSFAKRAPERYSLWYFLILLYVRASFFCIFRGVVSEHFCSWAGLFFQDNFCHWLTSDQSVTKIILKKQPRPRTEMFWNDPRNVKKLRPNIRRQTDRQTNKQTNKPTPRWSINDSNILKSIKKTCPETYKIIQKHSKLNRSLPRLSKNTKTTKITKKTKRRNYRNTAIDSKKRTSRRPNWDRIHGLQSLGMIERAITAYQ